MDQPPTKRRGLSEATLEQELAKKLQAKFKTVSEDYVPYKQIIDYMLQGEGETITQYQKHLGFPTVEEAYASFFQKYKQDILRHKQELDQNYSRLMQDVQEQPPMPEAQLNSFASQPPSQPATQQGRQGRQYGQQERSSEQDFQDIIVGALEGEEHDVEDQFAQQESEIQDVYAQQQEQYAQQQERIQQQQQREEAEAKVNAKYQKHIQDIDKEYERRRKNVLKGPDILTRAILWLVFGLMYAVDATIGMIPFIGDVQAYIISMMCWAIVSLFVGAGMFTYTALFYAGDLVGGLVLDAIPGLGTAVSIIFDFAYEPGRALLGKAPMQHYKKKYFEGLDKYMAPATTGVSDA